MSEAHPRWRVTQASFATSAAKLSQCLGTDLPEVAIAGRSNVGKSSLLNAVTGRTGLARVSRTPGRTQLLNYFHLRLREVIRQPMSEGESKPAVRDLDMHLVDLPGYGYAAASRKVREGFGPMVETYLGKRKNLRGLILLVDSRRELGQPEYDLLEFMTARGLPTVVCVTKLDKLKRSEQGLVAARFAKKLGVDKRDILLTSSLSKMGLSADDKYGGLPTHLGELACTEMCEEVVETDDQESDDEVPDDSAG